jgi:AcrR family transcriptional regulator
MSVPAPETAPRLDLRERRKLQTRMEVVEASLELFQSQGFEATTVDQIAKRAGISMPTFYRYFPSKDAILFFDAEERVTELRAALRNRAPGESIVSPLRDFFITRARNRDSAAHTKLLKLRHSILMSTPVLRGIILSQTIVYQEVIAEVIAEDLGLDRNRDLLPRFVAGAVIGSLSATGWHWETSGELVSRFSDVFDLLEKTIGPLLAAKAGGGTTKVRRRSGR